MILAGLLATASIFHGTTVAPEQAPWLVTLTRASTVCGGALIAPDRVLTAAHCVQGADPDELSVRLKGRRHAWRGAIFPTGYRELPSPVEPDDPRASGGGGKTRRVSKGRVGCSETARTSGGHATEDSYNQL